MKILLLSPIDGRAVDQLRKEHDVVSGAPDADLVSQLATSEVVVLRSGVALSAEVLRQAPRLRLIVRAGSGTDNIDLAEVGTRGIAFVRIPEPGAQAVAEMSFALMLALARNVVQADRLWRQGRWAKHELTGHGLRGKVLGVLGAGSIGSRVGALGAAWGMDVIGCVERPSPPIAAELAKQGLRLCGCDEVLEQADFLSIHVPLTPRTRNLVDAAALARMKPGAFLVNLARGGVVDELALREALESGHLSGAALDVHAAEGEGRVSPLADLSNVVLTPHIGAGTHDAQREIGRRLVEIVSRFHAEDQALAQAQVLRDSVATGTDETGILGQR